MLSFYLSMLDSEQEIQSFTAVYHAYRHQALYVAYAKTKNQEMAEDALHNAFLEIIEKHREYLALPEAKLRSLLMRIVKNRAIDLIRKEQLPKRAKLDDDADIPSDEKEISVEIASAEGYQTLLDCIDKLDGIYQATCELKYKYEKTNDEIAETLGISTQNVRKRISRAHVMLRDMLVEAGYQYEP